MLAALIVSGRVEMNCLAHNGKTGVRIIFCLLVLLVIVPVHGRAGAQQLSIREIRRIGPAYGGHGGMWADTDGDGLPDLYMTYNGSSGLVPDFYFHNNGNETFQDQTQVSGLDDTDGGSHGACWADLDNDGDYDLINATTYVVSSFSNTNDLFENLGNGQFVRIQGTPLDSRHEKTRAILAFDMDGDGDLDIFAVNGYRGSDSHENNEVYRNDGDFRFTQITSGALYGCPAGQGATDTDFDGDGDVDVLEGVGNFHGAAVHEIEAVRIRPPADHIFTLFVHPFFRVGHHLFYDGIDAGFSGFHSDCLPPDICFVFSCFSSAC